MLLNLPYYIFAWIASLGYGLVVVCSKFTSKYSIKNPWLFAFVYNLFVLAFLVPLTVYNGARLPTTWLNVSLAGVFLAVGFLFYVLALYKLDVSVLSPLFNLRIAFSVLLGVIILKEILGFQQYLLISIIFIAGIFASVNEKTRLKSFLRSSTLLILISTLFLAFMGIYINRAVADIGLWSATLFSHLVIQIALLVTFPLFVSNIKSLTKTQLLALFGIAGIDALATVAANKAYAGNVSISATIISLPISMIMAILLAAFKPQLLERHPAYIYAIRLSAALVMFLSALKLSI